MKFFLSLIMVLFFSINSIALGQEKTNVELGFRGGVDSGKVSENMHAYEIYILYELPYTKDFSKKMSLKTRLDSSVNYLDVESEDGIMFSCGVDIYLDVYDFLELEVGLRPTIMSNYTFGEEDLGGGFQFTSHFGAAFNWHDLVFNYRLQHTSNADIYDSNPGFNLHLWGLGYRF